MARFLQIIAKKHQFRIVSFKNEKVKNKVNSEPTSICEYYEHTIAEQMKRAKKNIIKDLRKYGIHALLTKPENLTVDAINAYLSIRKRGVL